jgi:hypothetical protein
MKNILNNCVSFNIKTLKRRSVQYNVVPKEFSVVELRKDVKNVLDSFDTFVEKKKTIFRPDKYDLKPIVKTIEPILPPPPIVISPIEIALPIKEEPIIIQPTPEPVIMYEPMYTTTLVGGGGGGGGGQFDTQSLEQGREMGTGFIVDRSARENLL